MSPLYWGAPDWTQNPDVVSQVDEQRGKKKVSSLDLLAAIALKQPRTWWTFIAAQGIALPGQQEDWWSIGPQASISAEYEAALLPALGN